MASRVAVPRPLGVSHKLWLLPPRTLLAASGISALMRRDAKPSSRWSQAPITLSHTHALTHISPRKHIPQPRRSVCTHMQTPRQAIVAGDATELFCLLSHLRRQRIFLANFPHACQCYITETTFHIHLRSTSFVLKPRSLSVLFSRGGWQTIRGSLLHVLHFSSPPPRSQLCYRSYSNKRFPGI
jgi:hypothetical protein